MERRVLPLLAACGALLLAAPAGAYGWDDCSGKVHWDRGWNNLYISTTSFPAGSAWDGRLQNAMFRWNDVKGSGFLFYVGRDTDGSHALGNGVSEVYATPAPSGSALAVTRIRYSCYWFFGWVQGIDETDVAFDSNLTWSTAALNYANLGSPWSFEAVALHEFGHALGLNHEDRWMATMNSFYPDSGPLGQGRTWDPLPDDREGARFLYPDATTETDVAASVFRSTGGGSSGLVASATAATAGSSVSLGFSFGNLGIQRADFQIGFYLSHDDAIGLGDVLLGTSTAWAERGAMGTYTRSLTIPASTPAGDYFLGFFVDHGNALVEAKEGNNPAAMPRPIRISARPAICRSDRDCPADRQCIHGRCIRRLVFTPCASDEECAPGEVCRHRICLREDVTLPNCDHIVCPEGCACRRGACLCHDLDLLCARMLCPSDTVCLDGACVPFGGFPPFPRGPLPPPPR